MDFTRKYDVVVAGAGVAGVAAALAAAELGAKTALIEKTVFFGGLGTTGLIYAYLPICDGQGTQVSFGLAERLLKLSVKYGPGTIPPDWDKKPHAGNPARYAVEFSPASFIIAIDEALAAANVDCWVDTLICGGELDGDNRLRGLWVENKSGRGLVEADCFVDATGDGEALRRVGGAVEVGGNYLAIWAMQHKSDLEGEGFAALLNMKYCQAGEATQRGLSGREVSRFILDGRELLRKFYDAEHAAGKYNRNTLYPVMLPAMPQYRKIARIIGKTTLSDNQHDTCFEDSVGMAADWRKPGPVWEMPYSTLLPEKIKGALAAGRCVSATGDAWEITRVIPTAAVTGEAAGVAAALAVAAKTTPDCIPCDEVQKALRARGVQLHLPYVGLKYQ